MGVPEGFEALIHVESDDSELQRRGSTAIGAMLLTAVGFLLGSLVFWPLESNHVSSVVLLGSVVVLLVLVEFARRGRVDPAVYGYSAVLWLVVTAQPLSNQDLSTNPILIPVAAIVLLAVLPTGRLWLIVVWIVTALLVLQWGTTDAGTPPLSREVWILNAAITTLGGLAVIVFARARLSASWHRERELGRQIERYEQVLAELREAANTDPLTGLANRRALAALWDDPVPVRPGGSSAVALIDLDNLKAINDTHSHATGDELLLRFAQALDHRRRSTDLLFRSGGDEFVMVSRTSGAHGLAEWLRTRQDELATAQWPTLPGDVTPSMSAGVVSPGALTLGQAVALADHGLRQAKAAGRSTVLVADPNETGEQRGARVPPDGH